MFSTFFNIFLSLKFKEVKEKQQKNISLIFLTLLVLKLEKFKEIKEEQSLYMHFILDKGLLKKK